MREPADVFFSYNRADSETVERLAERLRRERIEVWLDRWHLTGGDRWQEEIAEGLRMCRACAVLVGATGLGGWAREEVGIAQDRATKDHDFRLFMVLLPGAPDPLDSALAFLRNRSWVDLRSGVADPDRLQELIGAISGVPSPRDYPVATAVCPYRGLSAFGEENSEFFFGRGDYVKRVVEKLKHTRFLGVLGPSGGGKTSLLRAGVIPALKAGVLPGSDSWTIRTFTPGAQPLSMLAAQVARLCPGQSMMRTLEELNQDHRTLDLAVMLALAERPPDERVLLVVDQFEELFALSADEKQRAAFLTNLLHAATVPGGRTVVIIGMRADFYHRCADYPDLASLISTEQFLVGPLDAAGLRQAIEAPADRVGLEFEPGLVDTILDDVAGRPGTLPLLGHVLLELWQNRCGRMLTLEAYVTNGRVAGALAVRAEDIYKSLSPVQRRVVRRVLLRLVQPGEGVEDTRRRASLAELVVSPAHQADVEFVVQALANQRLLTTGRDEFSGTEVVEMTHEALIRGWPRFRRWVNEDRDALRAHRRLAESATEWDQNARDEGLLYQGSRLAYWQERDITELNKVERAFLATGRQREVRERTAGRRRVRLAVAGLSTALVIISAVALVAIEQSNRASERADVAVSRQLTAYARAQLGIDPELGLLLAMEAYKRKPTDEAGSVLRQATMESRVRATYRDHEGFVAAAAFSPDGRLIVSAGDDGTVRVRDRTGSKEPVVLRGHEGAVLAAAFSPDGRMVVSAGSDATVRVWDRTGTGEPVVLRGHQDIVSDAAFSPDGAMVVSASNDGTVRVWGSTGAGEPVVLRGHNGPVYSAAFGPDSQLVVSGGADATVRVRERTGTGEPVVLRGHQFAVKSTALSRDGSLVLSGGGNEVRLWDRTGAQEPKVLRGHVGSVNAVSFSPDEQLVVSANSDGAVRVGNRTGVGDPVVLRGHKASARSAAFSPDGGMVLSAGNDGVVSVWERTGPGEPTVLRGHQSVVWDAAFSPDGGRVVSAGGDGTVRVWDPTGSGESVVLGRHQDDVYSASVSPDGRSVVSAGRDGTVRVWEMTGGQEAGVWRLAVNSVAFSPDGRLLVGAERGGAVRVWARSGAEDAVVLRGHRIDVNSAVFSPDGRLIVSAGTDDTIRVWDRTGAGEAVVLSGHRGSVNSVAFSPDGRLVISAGGDGTVRLWDRTGAHQPVVLRGHQGAVREAAFSPDGRLVVSAGDDDTVRVWDRAGAAEPLVLRGHEEEVESAAFSPDGQFILSAGFDDTVRVWKCEVCGALEDVISLARQRVTRELTPEERMTFLHERPRP